MSSPPCDGVNPKPTNCLFARRIASDFAGFLIAVSPTSSTRLTPSVRGAGSP
jgi:hypothetical protein